MGKLESSLLNLRSMAGGDLHRNPDEYQDAVCISEAHIQRRSDEDTGGEDEDEDHCKMGPSA